MPPELQECFLRPRSPGVNLCSMTVAYTPKRGKVKEMFFKIKTNKPHRGTI